MTITIEKIPSPNHSSRRGRDIQAVVLHYTAAGSAHGSASWFSIPESRVSSHYIIGRQGHIIQCVELDRSAWHCGIAELVVEGEAHSDANERTIGIELANFGCRTRLMFQPHAHSQFKPAILQYDNGHVVDDYWEVYPDSQIDALQALLLRLSVTHGEAVQNLVGHEEIAMPLGRKMDPGPLFPWERFYRRTPRRTKRIG